MEKQPKRFGDHIKELRRSKGLTLKDLADYLEISLTWLSDIECNRRKPFERDKMELFINKFSLCEEQKNMLYDLAAREAKNIPQDIEDALMYSKEGDLARLALRKTIAGSITIDDWKRLIQLSEEEEGDG